MKHPSLMSRTTILVEGALMMAIAYGLSLLPSISLPFGGTISWFATGPILLFSLRHGGKWGLAVASCYGLLQALNGMDNVLFLKTVPTMILCVLLDYLFAYAVLGLAGPVANLFKNRTAGITIGVLLTGACRLLCSFLSGILLWSSYAPEGIPVWQYSITYNASWAVPDVAMALIAILALSRVSAMGLQKQPVASAS